VAPATLDPAVESAGGLSDHARAEPALDGVAFRSLYDEQHAFVWRSLLHLGVDPSAVDDGVQQVFLVVHRRFASYDRAMPLRAWLWGIARHVAHNERRTSVRAARRRDAVARDVPAPLAPSPERSGDLRFVGDILLEMDDAHRDVLVLADVEELTAPEIAAALGLNVNTAYSRLRVARQRFAEAVRRRGRAPGGDDHGR
jgi:RNA polymerase sigma-70 factor (ECF subfamily)